MTPQELKNSILQLAIQGKLVEQRPEEGTGEELYRQISDPEVGNETPFDIPETWRWAHLDNLVSREIRRGKSPKYDDNGSAYAFAQKCNSKYDGIQLGLALKISDCSLSRYTEDDELKDGDIVINSTGTGTLGRIGLFEDTFNVLKAKYYPDSHVTIVRAVESVAVKYLYYCLNYYRPFLEHMGEGSTNQKELKPATIKNLLIPLPPLFEQHRIVAKIEELLPLIDRYEAAWNRLEDFNKRFPTDMQKSLLQMAIQGKLVEQRSEEGTGEELYQQIQAEKQALINAGKIKKEKSLPEITDDEIPFEIPKSWKWVRFGELGSYRKGPFGSALTKSMFVPKGNNSVKVYEQKNAIQKDATLGNYYITREYFETKMKGFEVSPGDVIVSCAGTIGETYIMPDNIEQGIINQALMRMKLFNPIFIPYFLVFFDCTLKQNARGSSKGSAIKNIPAFETLKIYLVPIPPLAEQKRIVAKLDELLPLCERLK